MRESKISSGKTWTFSRGFMNVDNENFLDYLCLVVEVVILNWMRILCGLPAKSVHLVNIVNDKSDCQEPANCVRVT